jgi:NADPH-dependent 2,4-dienoyl-CoA reductase/sulfur reductase-like enzyme
MTGCEVKMVVPETGLGARVFPRDLAHFLEEYYREKGVLMHMGEGVATIAPLNGGHLVKTTKGNELEADATVAGLGIQPSVELAQQAGLPVDNGIVVNEYCATTNPDIYAAGDVANFPNPALGTRIRVEHEDNANSMGKTAGMNMAGGTTRYDHLPFFYSDLFDLGYEAVGELDPRLNTFSDWVEPFRQGVVYYLKDGRVRGVLLWNTWGQVETARALIAEPGPFDAGSLTGRIR